MATYYKKYKEFFRTKLRKEILEFDIDLVLYDETEFFRQHDHPLFNYPYTPRKNMLSSYKFNLPFDDPEYKLEDVQIKL